AQRVALKPVRGAGHAPPSPNERTRHAACCIRVVGSGETQRRRVTWPGPFAGRPDALPAALLTELSHELRSPLSTIVVWTHLMRRQPPDPEAEQGLAAIERSAEALLLLAEQLLDLARLLQGQPTLEQRPLDLAAVLADAVGEQQPLADARGVSL